MAYKHPLPARLFKKHKEKVFKTFYVTILLYMIIVIFVINVKPTEVQFNVQSGGMTSNMNSVEEIIPEQEMPKFEPFQIEKPKEIIEETFVKQYSYPWGDENPSWSDSQKYPNDYYNWLNEKHPNYEILMVKAIITAYTPHPSSCGPNAKGITATMGDAWTRGIAVPKPLLTKWRKNGTRVHVPGYMWKSYSGYIWKPDDCGSALLRTWKGGLLHIDVRFYNEGWAREWGVKHGYIFILRPK